MPEVIFELLATEAAVDKLGARGITIDEASRLVGNRHVIVSNPNNTASPWEAAATHRGY